MSRPPAKKIPKVWDRPGMGREASAGYDLAGNILVGLGLGWLLQRFFPGIKPWGYAGGIILGSISGFYQLFQTQSKTKPGPRSKKDDEQDHA